jgi:hypothetical protein
VSALSGQDGYELIVGSDGSIAADQLSRLGIQPGAHLLVLSTTAGGELKSLEGAMTEFPDLSWAEFERGSELARRDLTKH